MLEGAAREGGSEEFQQRVLSLWNQSVLVRFMGHLWHSWETYLGINKERSCCWVARRCSPFPGGLVWAAHPRQERWGGGVEAWSSSAVESWPSKTTDNIISGGGANSVTHPHKNHAEVYWRQWNEPSVERIWGRMAAPKRLASVAVWFCGAVIHVDTALLQMTAGSPRCEKADKPERLSLALVMLVQIRKKM